MKLGMHQRQTLDDHQAHMPHEQPRAWIMTALIAVTVGVVIVAGTFALFG